MASGSGNTIETLEGRLRRPFWLVCWVVCGLALVGGVYGMAGCGGGAEPSTPTPIIENIFPSNVTAGSQGFTMFVNGADFIADSQGVTFAYWNGSARSTVLNAQTGELAVTILPSDVAAPGVASLSVANPPPGGSCTAPGGNCGNNAFQVYMPQPTDPAISSFSPTSAQVGGMEFTLTVNGSNFAAGDVVVFDAQQRPATFVSQNKITFDVAADDLLTAGFASIAVSLPGLVTQSPTVNFPVIGPSSSTPSISSISPSTIAAGSTDFQMVVKGSNFAPNAYVEWNGVPLATAFEKSSQIVALVPAAAVASMGNVNVTVTNPNTAATPGGGTSGATMFTISAP